ncbi:MAG: EF-P 5-aminopentanol modification-associated protein YfmF [Clostridia bacterium]
MSIQEVMIKEGIKLHKIETNKFKTNLIAVFLTTPLTRENVTKDALITAILRRGSKNLPSQNEISKKLEEMYGGEFDCGIEKTGDNHVIKFYLETLNDEFLPEKEELLKKSMNILFDIIFNPYVENEGFKEEYFQGEKENLKQLIEGKIDNKATYALDKCIEHMYQNEAYGLYKYGYVEDLEKMSAKDLYQYYQDLISKCKIDIFISGQIGNEVEEITRGNEMIKQLKQRNPEYIQDSRKEKKEKDKIDEIKESMKIAQGKLVIGLDILNYDNQAKYVALMYNAILGGTANSKLFQNVREKASLAYTAASSYVRQKNNIFIRCGIEIPNYQKAVDIIKKQLEDMKKGDFTQEELENTRTYILSTIKGIEEEQDTEITYYLGQELSGYKMSIEEYENKIKEVTKEKIIEIAKQIKINTIYFLKD